jgi:DNA ligase (NAD+)
MSQRIIELETEIRRHSQLYYDGMPEITDAEFDELVDELKELDPTSAALAEVGAVPTWGRKVKHPSLMGSLEKVNESDALMEWFENLPTSGAIPKILLASTKVDGLAVRLRYAKGELVEAATRGDGTVGQDVLENAKRIKTIPQTVKDFTGEVRGEVYMRKDVWQSFNGQFANPRNGAAGGLLQKDASETERRNLSFLAYGLEENGADYTTEMECAHRAKSLGFDYVQWEEVAPVHLEAFLLDWESNRRAKLDFQIDGLVFAVNSFEIQEEAGWNGKRPRGKMAWKFKPEQREATVMGVDWQVGRTGKLTPVLRIEPTHIDGSTVSNISLASAALFEGLNLGRGEKVLIEKAGDIIPQVVRVTWRPLSGSKLEMPTTCPSCGGAVAKDGAHIFCNNPACPKQLCRRVQHWLNVQDVKGAGPSIVASMCAEGIVNELSDLYYMDADTLERATGSHKIAENILKEIMMKSEMPLWKFMAGLGVPSLGKTASKAIAKKYTSISEVMDATVSELSELDGIGEVTATQILHGLSTMQEDIEALERVLEIEEPVTGGALSGLSFCLTGAMSRNRKEIAAEIEAAGGEVKSSVGKGLTYLVQADPSSQSSKTKKAEKYGTEVISEEQLMEMMIA